MDAMPADHQQLMGRNIRRFREERGLSVAALARRAGVAKQTLSTIEHGRGNPTVETLALLSEALDVSMRRLFTEWGTPVYLQRRADAEWIDRDVWRERMLDEVYGSGYVRTLVLQLSRGQAETRTIEPLGAGTLHHVYVLSGRVRAGPLNEPVDLGVGDFVRYPGDVPHRMDAITEQATALMVATLPQLRQTAGSDRG